MNRFSNITYLGHMSDMNFRNLSNNDNGFIKFLREMKTPNSELLRKKVFGAYCKFRTNFPNNISPSGEIENFCKTIVNHFYNFNFNTMRANFNEITDNKLESLSMKTKNILDRLLKVTSTLCFDESESTEPIKIFFDVKYNYYDLEKLDYDPLEFKIENGFFKFVNHPERIHMTIILNIEYLKRLFTSNLEMIDYDPLTEINNNESEFPVENKFRLKVKNTIDKFWKDFLSAFTISLYKDRYREMFYSQIYTYFYMLDEEKNTNYKLFYASNAEEFKLFFSKYQPFFKKMNLLEDRDEIDPWFKLNVMYVLNSFHIKEFSDFSPIDMYNGLFETSHLEINTLRMKLKIYEKLEPVTFYSDIDSTITDLNKPYKSEITNLITTTLLYKRLVPIIIFTEFFINNGKKHIETKNLLSKFLPKVSNLKSFSHYNLITDELEPLLVNIEKDVKLFSQSRTFFSSFHHINRIINIMKITDDETLEKIFESEIEKNKPEEVL